MGYEINGTYGSHKTPCVVFVNDDGWYVVDGSQNVNQASLEELIDGVDVETVNDFDSFYADSPINSLDELEDEVFNSSGERENYDGKVVILSSKDKKYGKYEGIPLLVEKTIYDRTDAFNGEEPQLELQTLDGEDVPFCIHEFEVDEYADSKEEALEEFFEDKFYLIAIDETNTLKDELKNKAGKMLGYYLVNTDKPLYPADTSAHVEGYFLYNRVQNVEAFSDEELTEIESQAGRDDNPLFLYEEVVNIFKTGLYDEIVPGDHLVELASCDEDTYVSAMERFVDECRGNPVEFSFENPAERIRQLAVGNINPTQKVDI
jgi:hypothetical protein